MIRDFSVTPRSKNSKAKILMAAFFAVAAALLVVAFFIDSYKGVVGLAALFSATTAIFVYVKYVSVVFHYDILAEGEDEPLFVIRQSVGKRSVTLARIAFRDIVSIEKETLSERRSHKTEKGVNKYSFTPTLAPDVSYRITTKNESERTELIIEGSDEFIDMLRSFAAEARELYADSDD